MGGAAYERLKRAAIGVSYFVAHVSGDHAFAEFDSRTFERSALRASNLAPKFAAEYVESSRKRLKRYDLDAVLLALAELVEADLPDDSPEVEP